MKIMAYSPITSWQIDGEKEATLSDLFSWGPQLLGTVNAATKLKDSFSLEEIIYGVAQSRTRLKRLSSSRHLSCGALASEVGPEIWV